jgi:Cu+-exporting ATPase
MSVMVATGRAATAGVLFLDAEAIEKLRAVDTLIVDNTGTLTEGRPAFRTAIATAEFDETRVLRLAASLDTGSEHPLAAAIVQEARRREIVLDKVESFESGTGLGVRGSVGGLRLALGSAALMRELGIPTAPLETEASHLREEGASVMFLAVEGSLAGLIAVSDPVKSTTQEALETLRRSGLRIVMASGDAAATARAVASAVGITEVHGESRPAEKADMIARLREEGRVVAMAGDGINDAPALAAADVGIAMGTGTDVAISSSKVTLVKGDLRGIARARQISESTVSDMWQNLGFALIYNALGVPIAAGVLWPWTGLLLSPMIAALAMSLSSVSVVGNALRLRRK